MFCVIGKQFAQKPLISIYKNCSRVSKEFKIKELPIQLKNIKERQILDIEKTSSFFKKLKNDKPKPLEKVKEDAVQFMADIYESALKEAKLKLQNFEFSKASVIFYKMIESIPKLTLKNDPLNRILAEAYLQEGVILSKGNIKESEKAFEFFKIAADLDPKNELAKEKLLEMKYESGDEIISKLINEAEIYISINYPGDEIAKEHKVEFKQKMDDGLFLTRNFYNKANKKYLLKIIFFKNFWKNGIYNC